MAALNNLRLLFISFSLLLSFESARTDLSPSFSPEAEPSPGSGPAPLPSVGSGPALAPSPELETPLNDASPPPSKSNSPVTDGAAESDGSDYDDQFDLSPTRAPNSISPVPDGPAESNGPIQFDLSPNLAPKSISPVADGQAESDGPIQFDLSPILAPEADINPKVKQICDSTDHPALCLAMIIPRLDGDSDVPTIVEIAIRTTAELAKIALSLARNVANNPRIPPELASILRDCKDSFDDAVYNFQRAIDAFPSRDVGTMNSMLSAVITEVGDCEDAFSGFGEESPFISVADRLTNMTSNCLAIVSLLN